MFCLGSGCETSCLTKKSLDACIGGKFQFLISLFTLFYWGLIVGLNAMVIFNYISKKRSSCLDIIEFFSEIKITLKYPNESLNSKPIINCLFFSEVFQGMIYSLCHKISCNSCWRLNFADTDLLCQAQKSVLICVLNQAQRKEKKRQKEEDYHSSYATENNLPMQRKGKDRKKNSFLVSQGALRVRGRGEGVQPDVLLYITNWLPFAYIEILWDSLFSLSF